MEIYITGMSINEFQSRTELLEHIQNSIVESLSRVKAGNFDVDGIAGLSNSEKSLSEVVR